MTIRGGRPVVESTFYGKRGGQVTDDEKGRTTDGGKIGEPIISTGIHVIIKLVTEGDGNDGGDCKDRENMWESNDREDEDEFLFVDEDDHYNNTNR